MNAAVRDVGPWTVAAYMLGVYLLALGVFGVLLGGLAVVDRFGTPRRFAVWATRRNLRRVARDRRKLGARARQIEAAIACGHPSATDAARRELASLAVLLAELDDLADELLDELHDLGATT